MRDQFSIDFESVYGRVPDAMNSLEDARAKMLYLLGEKRGLKDAGDGMLRALDAAGAGYAVGAGG